MVEIAVKALSLVAVVGLALVLKRVGWASIRDFPLVSRLVLSVTLPCALLTSFNEYTLDTALLSLVLIGLVATSAQQVIGYLLARRRGRREQAFAVLNSGSFNIGALACPTCPGSWARRPSSMPHCSTSATLWAGPASATAGAWP